MKVSRRLVSVIVLLSAWIVVDPTAKSNAKIALENPIVFTTNNLLYTVHFKNYCGLYCKRQSLSILHVKLYSIEESVNCNKTTKMLFLQYCMARLLLLHWPYSAFIWLSISHGYHRATTSLIYSAHIPFPD